MQSILDRIEVIERTIQEADSMARLLMPLIAVMLPMVKVLDDAGVPKENRHIEISQTSFLEQYNAGINKVLGVQIHWA